MRRLYRVLFYDPNAANSEPGGVLFIPPQGAGRVDNPNEYHVLYAGDSPAGVCAEVFNRGKYRSGWTPEMFVGGNSAMRRVLAWYDLPETVPICNLDDPTELVAQSLRPSNVITRDYAQSRAWALRLFTEQRWVGVSWWSYHDARWASLGIWQPKLVVNYGFEELTIEHPAIVEAASVLAIQIRR